MSDSIDEHLYTFSKAGEYARGDFDDGSLSSYAGLLGDERDNHLAWLDQFDDFRSTDLAEVVIKSAQSKSMGRAMSEGDARLAAYLQGVTERDIPGSQLSLALAIMKRLENNAAPAFLTVAGNPETGKTNTVSLLAELRTEHLAARGDELLVVSNIRNWTRNDETVSSMHDLMEVLIEHRGRPKFVAIDEASTHFDARTFSREVSQQWTPAAKRFAKLNVDACAVIGHTGKDVHPEAKRLTTTALWKQEKEIVEFYGAWDADDDSPKDPLFSGPVSELQATRYDYPPDDPAPWSWNLEADLFARDLSWSEFLTRLRERGSPNN